MQTVRVALCCSAQIHVSQIHRCPVWKLDGEKSSFCEQYGSQIEVVLHFNHFGLIYLARRICFHPIRAVWQSAYVDTLIRHLQRLDDFAA